MHVEREMDITPARMARRFCRKCSKQLREDKYFYCSRCTPAIEYSEEYSEYSFEVVGRGVTSVTQIAKGRGRK